MFLGVLMNVTLLEEEKDKENKTSLCTHSVWCRFGVIEINKLSFIVSKVIDPVVSIENAISVYFYIYFFLNSYQMHNIITFLRAVV